MARTQKEKAEAFRQLHQRTGTFLIPNPWDIGTARLLESLDFEALATTSAGHAFSLGQPDGAVGRDGVMTHIAAIATATDLPVSADLGSGFGDSPEEVASAIHLAAAAGAVGCSIEDATANADAPIYEFGLATERIRAAAEAARSLPFPFTLTARCENFLFGVKDVAATIKRLQAYEKAGADVLYAPGLTRRDDIAAVTASLDHPLNVLMGLPPCTLNRQDLADIGVKRISVGSALSRCAIGAFLKAAREMREHGTFTFAEDAVGSREMNMLLGTKRSRGV